jgi:hypothetical protein
VGKQSATVPGRAVAVGKRNYPLIKKLGVNYIMGNVVTVGSSGNTNAILQKLFGTCNFHATALLYCSTVLSLSWFKNTQII